MPTRILEHPHIEHPSFLDLPDGRRAFLYQAVDPPQAGHGIYVQVVGETQRRLLIVSSSSNPYPAYSSSGNVVYVDGTGDSIAIWALPFSLTTLQATGKPFPVAQHGSSPQVSRTDTLVYSDVPPNRLQLMWLDRSGKILSTIGEPEPQNTPVLSPDGRKLAVQLMAGNSNIGIYDVDRGTKSRFTPDQAAKLLGAWKPSGDEILYSANPNGNFDVFSKPVNGNGEAVLRAKTPQNEIAMDWSQDQKFILYTVGPSPAKNAMFYREQQKDGSFGEAIPFLQTPFNERGGKFSPDGRFVVYVSDESGRNEIYVRDFPKGVNKWQISNNGGLAPRWSRSGEIFFVEQRKLMAVSVTMHPSFSAGTPAALFEKRSLITPGQSPNYDVSADGRRFVIPDRLNDQPLLIHVAHNWYEEFRGR
jgi:hypothetical protein